MHLKCSDRSFFLCRSSFSGLVSIFNTEIFCFGLSRWRSLSDHIDSSSPVIQVDRFAQRIYISLILNTCVKQSVKLTFKEIIYQWLIHLWPDSIDKYDESDPDYLHQAMTEVPWITGSQKTSQRSEVIGCPPK